MKISVSRHKFRVICTSILITIVHLSIELSHHETQKLHDSLEIQNFCSSGGFLGFLLRDQNANHISREVVTETWRLELNVKMLQKHEINENFDQ